LRLNRIEDIQPKSTRAAAPTNDIRYDCFHLSLA
jgi:hypothetical protein